MSTRICCRERDVLDLVAIGQWPRQASADLVDHVSACASCREALLVASAFSTLHSEDAGVPALPDARAVWQRAQWQARREAVERAARPVVAMQAVTAVIVLAAIVSTVWWLAASGVLGAPWQTFAESARGAGASARTMAVAVGDLFTFDVPSGFVWLFGGALALGLSVLGVAFAFSTLVDRSEA